MSESAATISPVATTVASHRCAVLKVIHRMKSDLMGCDIDLSLDALSEESCYSKPHLIEIFEQLTHTTPHHFLASLRIQRAKELLLASDDSVTDIALQVGYASCSTFSRTFSEFVGISPVQLRRRSSPFSFPMLCRAAMQFLARNGSATGGRWVTGRLVAPFARKGLIFVGAFHHGVPRGRPEGGTVLLKPGPFRLRLPDHLGDCHILSARVPNLLGAMGQATLPIDLVGGAKMTRGGDMRVDLMLRQIEPTDPPIVVWLPALMT